MKLYVGTQNKAKVAAVEEVMEGFEIIPMKSESDVSLQPLSDEETLNGAINRAKNLPLDGLRIGLEGGVTIINDQLFLINYGALIDEDNKLYTAGGTRLPLPNSFKKALYDDKKELSTVMEDTTSIVDGRNKDGAVGYFTQNLVKRKDIFTHIIKLLYGQYLKGKEE